MIFLDMTLVHICEKEMYYIIYTISSDSEKYDGGLTRISLVFSVDVQVSLNEVVEALSTRIRLNDLTRDFRYSHKFKYSTTEDAEKKKKNHADVVEFVRPFWDQDDNVGVCSTCDDAADLVMKTMSIQSYFVISDDCLPLMLHRLLQMYKSPDDILRNV